MISFGSSWNEGGANGGMHVKHRQTCRVCGSPHLTTVIDLGERHLQGSDYERLTKVRCFVVFSFMFPIA